MTAIEVAKVIIAAGCVYRVDRQVGSMQDSTLVRLVCAGGTFLVTWKVLDTAESLIGGLTGRTFA